MVAAWRMAISKIENWAREGAKFLYDWAQRGLHIHARNMHVLDFRMGGGFIFINLVYICRYNSECVCSHDICEVVGAEAYQNDRQSPQFPVLHVRIYGTEIRTNEDQVGDQVNEITYSVPSFSQSSCTLPQALLHVELCSYTMTNPMNLRLLFLARISTLNGNYTHMSSCETDVLSGTQESPNSGFLVRRSESQIKFKYFWEIRSSQDSDG